MLDAIRERLDIVDVVRDYIPQLRSLGRNFKALCPFHQEKTSSFMVSQEKQIFHCFGCGAGGDIYKFVMQIDGLSFPEAVEKCAARAGVSLESYKARPTPRDREREELKKAMAFAQKFYRGVLTRGQSAEAVAAQKYLEGRKVSAEIAERFGLGWAPGGGSAFLEEALGRDFTPELLSRAGLAAYRESAGKYRDAFWKRVLFPIRDPKGEVVGFGGRVLGDEEPKYLNSPETPLFSKGKVLYGFFEGLAEIRRRKKLVLLEGYMDVLAAHQFGIGCCVAPLGTAVTEAHGLLIKRYAQEVILLFDPDPAGQRASMRSAELLMELGIPVSIATLPEALDPDEFLHLRGAAAFETRLEAAQDLIDFQLDAALREAGPGDKPKIAADLLQTVAKQPDQILKGEWIRRLSNRLDLDEGSLKAELERTAKKAHSSAPSRIAAKQGGREPEAPLNFETEVIRFLLRYPNYAREAAGLKEAEFADARCRQIFDAMRQLIKDTPLERRSVLPRVIEALPEHSEWLTSLGLESSEFLSPQVEWEAIRKRFRRQSLLRKKELLDVQIRAMTEGAVPADAEIQKEYQRVLKELKGS